MPLKRKYLLRTIVLVAATLLLGELFARFYLGLGTPPIYIAHPSIEYLFKPDQDVHRFGNHVIVNRYGMRSRDFPQRKPPNELRVMVLGDSVINGGSLTEQDDLATEIVARNLAQSSGKTVVVGNISAGSWGPGNWLAYVREYGLFDADAVVLVISSHDYADNPTFQELQPNTHPTRQPVSALAEGIVRYLPRYLPWKHSAAADPIKNESEAPEPARAEIEKGLADLRSLLMLAKEQSRTVIVLQHAERMEIAHRHLKPGYYSTKSLCSELGIEPISLEPYFRRSLEGGVDPYRDNIHPNAAGQRLLAEAIIASLPEGYKHVAGP